MDFKEEYKSKLTDVEGALSFIKDGDTLVTGSGPVEPVAFLSQLHTIADRIHHITIMNGLMTKSHPFMEDEKYKSVFENHNMFMMGPSRNSQRLGITQFLPGHLHAAAPRWHAAGHEMDVFIAQATPMDKHGYMRVSTCLIQERYFIDHAKKIILEINPNLPVVYGDTEVHIHDVDALIEVNTPLPILPRSKVSEIEMAIGENVASLVNDGDCIQLGIGSIPDAVANALMTKHDLGVHTEMITSTMVDLVEAGVITGKKKNFNKGKIVGVFAMGDQKLYDFIDYNPSILMKRGEWSNDPAIIAMNDNFVSINSALSIDLGGQICSESIGSLEYSGPGGQVDTAVGAVNSKGGRNIIAVSSVKHTKKGPISTINAQLPAGSVVTLNRMDVDYIVTEYGIAPMKGRTVKERVDNLISIAHPDYREELRKDAQKLYLW